MKVVNKLSNFLIEDAEQIINQRFSGVLSEETRKISNKSLNTF